MLEEVVIKSELADEDLAISGRKQKRTRHMWPCAKCPETFDTFKMLKNHRKVHRKEENDAQYNYRFDEKRKLFVCKTCDLELADQKEMEGHVLVHEDKFTCEICRKDFFKPYEFSCHVYDHDKTKDFHCPLCKYCTPARTAMLTHIKTYHLRKYTYTCMKCGKGFNDCVMYKEHDNVHEGIKPFQCIVCNKEFTFSSYLSTHQIRHHRVTIEGMVRTDQCPICYKRFSKRNTLEKHLHKHENQDTRVREKKHLCDICGKGFATKEKLRVHYRVHTGDKPYACSYCPKSFTKKDYLVMHERVHSGEKPYFCEYCGKRFNQGAPLRIHVRTHTGERPYICHICNNGFISKGVLNLHFPNCRGGV